MRIITQAAGCLALGLAVTAVFVPRLLSVRREQARSAIT
jgi:hypothetical protein